jgi:hypothetical protein
MNKHNTRSPCLPDSLKEIAKTTSKKLTWGPMRPETQKKPSLTCDELSSSQVEVEN